MTINAIQPILAALSEGRNLTRAESARAFQIILNGGATPAQMGAFLIGLRLKGETAEEIAGGVEVLRIKAAPFPTDTDTMDCCGTGGDGLHTLNISTAVAFVLAACGVNVVKHGNRAVSSASGSADVLEVLGVKTDADAAAMQHTLKEAHFCFLLAPRYQPAMRHIAPVRQELGLRSIFNLLGPLANPARPAFQLVGVYDARFLLPMAEALRDTGIKRAWVVHGAGGMDELSLQGASQVVEVQEGALRQFTISPEDAGLSHAPASALKGDDAAYNAKALESLLTGEKTPYRDAVLLNAAAGLVIAGRAEDLRAGAAQATAAIDEGHALLTLRRAVELTRKA